MAVQTRVVDPINFELIKNALGTIADEMALTVVRTSRSGVLKDNMDFSTALCGPDGQLVAQGLTLPIHLGSMPDAMGGILRRYPLETIRPGDVFIMNDPFEGGMHLPDVFIVKPLFALDRLVAFACTVAHQTDMGGCPARTPPTRPRSSPRACGSRRSSSMTPVARTRRCSR